MTSAINFPDFYLAMCDAYVERTTPAEYLRNLAEHDEAGALLWRVSPAYRSLEDVTGDVAMLWWRGTNCERPAVPNIFTDYIDDQEPDPEGDDADRWHDEQVGA